MSAAQIIAGLAFLPVIIMFALQGLKAITDKTKFPLPPSSYQPLAILMGAAAAVVYQLTKGVNVDLAVAFIVGSAEGAAAMLLYDKFRGTFSPAEDVSALIPIIEALVKAEVKRQQPPLVPAKVSIMSTAGLRETLQSNANPVANAHSFAMPYKAIPALQPPEVDAPVAGTSVPPK